MATLPARPPLMPDDTGWISMGRRARCRISPRSSRATFCAIVVGNSKVLSTGTVSWRSWGRTSRNQDTQPATSSSAPVTLIEKWVTRPAVIRLAPKATTRGAAVGAGRSTVFARSARTSSRRGRSSVTCLLSAPDDVDDGEHDDPDDVHEVPVEPEDVRAVRVLARDLALEGQPQDDGQADDADDHVEGVQ